jgi:hypothetical protein
MRFCSAAICAGVGGVRLAGWFVLVCSAEVLELFCIVILVSRVRLALPAERARHRPAGNLV